MNIPARKIMQRIDVLLHISEDSDRLTRTFASPAMSRANDLVGGWMREAGMETHVDTIGNLIGVYAGEQPDGKILVLGSHLDTVRNAGRFDGPLGVILAIACVEQLHERKTRLPFAIQVVGFADEEGVRYQTAYLGSRALTGTFNLKDLNRRDVNGISMRDAIRAFGGNPTKLNTAALDPQRVIGYLETHIEQGPILEQKNLSVGVVTAIAGQTRARVSFVGCAGHAGTTPMNMRRDALCGAAEFVVAVETFAKSIPGLVATVGEINAMPGASNVIPAESRVSIDVRHAEDSIRHSACVELKAKAEEIGSRRNLQVQVETGHEAPAVACSEKLSALLSEAVKQRQNKLIQLPSGAGHDAAIMAEITPSAMLFVRCKEGISHDPRESADLQDVRVALDVVNDFIQMLAQQA
ncbi:MAG: allantoate deiminase [Verrucomicrobiota bacterium]